MALYKVHVQSLKEVDIHLKQEGLSQGQLDLTFSRAGSEKRLTTCIVCKEVPC
jgi:hypothetical protein